uniref:G_PROTEIN_RECEP_F1_2 domain-containing protein n=1 Tax=Rhabditophanes sp. KR3021 TaxID=114890 RepID=A0AC35UCN3_9BILA
MNEELYELFIIIANSVAIILNFISVFALKFKGSKKDDLLTNYLIWGRLGDAFFAFNTGIFLTIRISFSHIVVVSNGLCHALNEPYLCNISLLLWVLSISYNYCVIGFPLFAMRNVFVLKREPGYLSNFEKIILAFCHIVSPIITLSLSHLFLVPLKEIEDLLEKDSVFLRYINNSEYTVFMYDTKLTSIFMCTTYVLLFNYLFVLIYGHIYNYMPIRKELIKSKKEARMETVFKIEQALFKIATIYLFPILFGFSPLIIAFIGLNIVRIPVSKEVERLAGASVVIGPTIYYIMSPIMTIYTLRGNKSLVYGHIVNYRPIRKELIKSKKEARFETVLKIEQALFKIATIYLIPLFIGLSPFAIGFIVLNIFRIPVSKEVERWAGASIVIGPILYYIMSPIITIYTIRRSKKLKNKVIPVKPSNPN